MALHSTIRVNAENPAKAKKALNPKLKRGRLKIGCNFIAIIPADALQDVDNYTHIFIKPARCIVITNMTLTYFAKYADIKKPVY
jgi:hypothetical protein